MAQHRHFQLPGPDEHIPHEVGVVYVAAVVGQGNRPCRLQGLGIGGFLPAQAQGQGGDGVYPHAVGRFRPVQHIFDLLGAVHRRAGVGHAGHGGDAPPGGGGAAGEDVLLISKPGVPQVDVHIHQPGGHHQPGGVDGPVGLAGQAVLHQSDPSVLQQHVLKLDVSRNRVDHPAVFNQKTHSFLRSISGACRFLPCSAWGGVRV